MDIMDKSPYYDWYKGQRVFFYSPRSGTTRRWYGTLESGFVQRHIVKLYIQFDEISGVMMYENDYKTGAVVIYPVDNYDRTPDWEVQ